MLQEVNGVDGDWSCGDLNSITIREFSGWEFIRNLELTGEELGHILLG